MEQGCSFKGSLWFGILIEESIFSPPFSPVFVCKGSLAFIFTLHSAFPVKRENEDCSLE